MFGLTLIKTKELDDLYRELSDVLSENDCLKSKVNTYEINLKSKSKELETLKVAYREVCDNGVSDSPSTKSSEEKTDVVSSSETKRPAPKKRRRKVVSNTEN